MSALQKSVSSLQDQPHPAGRANSTLGGAQFGAFEANFFNRELRKNGIRVKLQEKPFQILEALLEKAGDMVRREELREKLWPDTYVGFDRSINTAIAQLRRALGDPANNPHFIETRHRLGYRFFASVKMWKGEEPPTHKIDATIDTIAVLPFDNSSGDSDMELLSARITENIIACLSRVLGVRVIGNSCVSRCKDRGMDRLAVGHDLHSRAVLTGWIARRSDNMTIGTELVDVPGGWRLWGEQYHLKLSGTLPIQTEIPEGICDKVRQGFPEPDTQSRGLFCDTAACPGSSVDSLRLSPRRRHWKQPLSNEYFRIMTESRRMLYERLVNATDPCHCATTTEHDSPSVAAKGRVVNQTQKQSTRQGWNDIPANRALPGPPVN